jgi:hypothetical protein
VAAVKGELHLIARDLGAYTSPVSGEERHGLPWQARAECAVPRGAAAYLQALDAFARYLQDRDPGDEQAAA